jgi:hypothetical protein
MPILYNVGNKLTAGSEPPQLYRYQDRVLGDGGTLETRDEASTFIRRLRSAGVLGSTVLAGVAGGVKAGTLYSIIGPDLDVTRGTVKNRVNRAGVLNQVASGVPATDFAGGVLRGTTVEPSSRNEIRNNTMQGAVVGSPGTLPTNWAETLSGLTRQVVGLGVENGIDYIDLRFSGTANATTCVVWLEGFTQILASNGQTWSSSIFCKRISEPSPPNSYRLRIDERTSAGANVLTDSLLLTIPTDVLSRFSFTKTFVGGGTVERTIPALQHGLTVGNSYDFTIRIGLPQMELGSVATSVIKTTGSAQTRNADVITKTGLGSVLPDRQGWFLFDGSFLALPNTTVPVGMVISNQSSTARRFVIGINSGGLLRFATRNDAGASVVTLTPFSYTLGDRVKVLLRWDAGTADTQTSVSGGVQAFVNGQFITSADFRYAGQLNRLNFYGASADSGFDTLTINKAIHSYAIGSGPITDAQAIQLTTL